MVIFFVYFFCLSCHLFFISPASVRSIPFLSFIVPIFAWNVPFALNFLQEISSLSHSVVILYFFALITEEGLLTSPCYSWNSVIRWIYLSFYHLPFTSLLFSAIYKASSDYHFAFMHFFLEMVLIIVSYTMSWTSVHNSSGILSGLTPWIYWLLALYHQKWFDLDWVV